MSIIFDVEKPKLITAANKVVKRLGHRTSDLWQERMAASQIVYVCYDCDVRFSIYQANRNGLNIFILWSGMYRIAILNHEFQLERDYGDVYPGPYPVELYCKRYQVLA